MLNILYTIFIFPIEQIIELGFVFIYRIFLNPALAVFGVSVFVSTLTLPLYFMAEKIQNKERKIQKKMKNDVDNIRTVFKGDERFMRLNTYYRQMGYHPLYTLRSSISLLIQIPFFIAAYNFLSNLTLLDGQSFFIINNLGTPDGLLNGINILPIIMTIINLISAFIYTKGFLLKDKIQLYGMAIIFIILLYNSPSALVLYWTCNNLYSLIKNILQKLKHSKKIVICFAYFVLIFLSVYLIFNRSIILSRRLIVIVSLTFIMLFPAWKKVLLIFTKKINLNKILLQLENKTFYFSLAGLLILTGLFNPSNLIASSTEEFSFLTKYSNPIYYIGFTFIQSLGFCIWILCIYLLLNKKARSVFAFFITIILFIFMFNTMTFTNEYGHLEPDLRFANFIKLSQRNILINTFFIIFTGLLFSFLIFRQKIITALQICLILAISFISLLNTFNINKEYKHLYLIQKTNSNDTGFDKKFTLSKTGKNIIVIVLDRAVSSYFPYILKEKPELKESFNGFVYYPNTISFGRYTIHGMPSIWGGYYYSASEIDKRKDELQLDKIYEGFQVLPRIMAQSGFNVHMDYQSHFDVSQYNNFPNITAENNFRTYMNDYMKNYQLETTDYHKILYKNLIRFSFIKNSPALLHDLLYDNGEYLTIINRAYPFDTIIGYSFLYYLPAVTDFTEEDLNYAIMFVNELAHSPAILQLPDYTLANNVDNTNYKENETFPNEPSYHVNMASYILLSKWLEFLKENDAYDNTRIIIVSDHGSNYIPPLPNDLYLSNNRWLRYYNALLLVKDFNSNRELTINNGFMTTADIPHITAENLIFELINPFTGNELKIDKDDGVLVTTNMNSYINGMGKYQYNIRKNEWLHVHTNIFDINNWKPHEFE